MDSTINLFKFSRRILSVPSGAVLCVRVCNNSKSDSKMGCLDVEAVYGKSLRADAEF